MKFYKVREECPELFADPYNVMFVDGEHEDGEMVDVYSMSHDANMPNGVCYYDGAYHERDVMGTEIPFKCLPHGLQRQIVNIERAYSEDLGGQK